MRNCHLGGSVPEDPNVYPCRPTLAENPYLGTLQLIQPHPRSVPLGNPPGPLSKQS